jgi:lipopolysaccharide/colanic/teichoic acid biosynthesis glycosyltransferase
LHDVVDGERIEDVFIVAGGTEMAELAPVAQDLVERGRVVSLVSIPGWVQRRVQCRITDFCGLPVLSLGPRPRDVLSSGLKRAFDLIFSSVGLLVSAPMIVSLAALMKVFDPGPAFFSQERLGKDGRKIRIYKFRSMRVDAETVLKANPTLYRKYTENDYKLPEHEDPRISRLGRFLRRSSLDELPQLWNVLKGDMSLVGPRPIVPSELEKFEPYAEILLSVRPGLTGRWQVSGRSEIQYPERAFMELDYAGEYSVVSDLSIMARTVPAVLKRRGAQ